MKPGQAVTVAASGLRPRLVWAQGKAGEVMTHHGKRVYTRVLRRAGRYRHVTLTPTQVT